MNVLYSFFDVFSKCFYDPRRNGRQVYGVSVPRLDWVRVRSAVTAGKARLDSNGIPLTQYQLPITDYSSSLFALKSKVNYPLDAAGKLDFTNGGGFDTSDTAWHSMSKGCFSLAPIVIPLTVNSWVFNSEIILLKSGSRWTLRADGEIPLQCDVQRDVYTGAESNAPSGLPGSLTGTWTISGTSTYTDITITGTVTTATLLALGVHASTGGAGDPGTIMQTPNTSNNTVRLSVSSAPGTGGAFTGVWTLVNL